MVGRRAADRRRIRPAAVLAAVVGVAGYPAGMVTVQALALAVVGILVGIAAAAGWTLWMLPDADSIDGDE